MKPKCKECQYSKMGGRGKYATLSPVYCEHPNANKYQKRFGTNFIDYSDSYDKDGLRLKTCKKWCPLIHEEVHDDD